MSDDPISRGAGRPGARAGADKAAQHGAQQGAQKGAAQKPADTGPRKDDPRDDAGQRPGTPRAAPRNRRGDVRLPDFVMLGQGKAGTSLIYRELQRRRDVGMSRQKELHFFNLREPQPEEGYVAQFAHIPPDVALVGEVAPDYLSVVAIDRILETLGPQTKLMVSLRHPVDQAYSRYIQNIAAGNETEPFSLSPSGLARRLRSLARVLRHLHDAVPPEQVLVLHYERDIAVPRAPFRRKVADFLGIPRRYPPEEMRHRRVNPGVMPRYLWSGDAPLEIAQAEGLYRIPRRTLVFCAQARNSKDWRKPTRLEVCEALARQSRWTPILEEDRYARLQEGAVEPAADALEAEFGFDMTHWRVAPRRVQYAFAPPPEKFLKAAPESIDAEAGTGGEEHEAETADATGGDGPGSSGERAG